MVYKQVSFSRDNSSCRRLKGKLMKADILQRSLLTTNNTEFNYLAGYFSGFLLQSDRLNTGRQVETAR